MFQMPLVAVPALQVVTVLMLVTARFACQALANTDALTETVICRRLSCQPAEAPAPNRSSVLKLVTATFAFLALANTDVPTETAMLPTYFNERSS